MPDVWINLAHIYMAQGQYVNAIKMVLSPLSASLLLSLEVVCSLFILVPKLPEEVL